MYTFFLCNRNHGTDLLGEIYTFPEKKFHFQGQIHFVVHSITFESTYQVFVNITIN